MLYDKRGLLCVILFCMFMYVLKNSNCFHSSVTEQYTDDTETFFSDIYFSEWITKIILFFCVASVEFYFSFLDTHHSGFTSFPLFFFGSPYKHTSLSFHHFNIHFLCLVSIKTASNHWKVCHLRGEHLSILEMDYWSWIQNLQRWWTEGKDRWVEKPNESLEGELMRLVK